MKFGTVRIYPLDCALTVKMLKFKKIYDGGGRHSDKNRKIASLTERHHPTLSILPNKTANIINQAYSEYKHSLTFRVRRYTHLQCISL